MCIIEDAPNYEINELGEIRNIKRREGEVCA